MIDPAIQAAAVALPHSKHGGVLTQEATVLLRKRLPLVVPDWYIELLSRFPLSGAYLSCKEAGNDVEIKWADAATIVSEALELYPGLEVIRLGYVPVATCTQGSGNHLFIRFDHFTDPPVVQIYHDVAAIAPDGTLRAEAARQVASSLSKLLSTARVLT